MTRDEAGEIWPSGMKIVNGRLAESIRAQGMIEEPNDFGYIHLAAEVEPVGLVGGGGARRKALLEQLKPAALRLLESDADTRRADVFEAFLDPPGGGEGRKLVAEAGYEVHRARFDVVVLIECDSPDAALRVKRSDAFQSLERLLTDAAGYVHCFAASNPKRIAEVDKTRDGIFLFNYFFAADVADKGATGIETLLGVWEYTAGWWTAKANLTNSTPLLPLPGEASQYSLVNHCRWDRKRDVLPSLVLRPSLRRFVLANFTANDIAAMPLLYHLA